MESSCLLPPCSPLFRKDIIEVWSDSRCEFGDVEMEADMAEEREGCVKPTRGPLTEAAQASKPPEEGGKGVSRMSVIVGRPAPDFEASAYVDGGFKNIKLSDYKDKWVVLCFYPGDFTFV